MVTKRGGLWRPRCYIRITTSNIESTSCILLKCLIDLYMYQRPSMLCCSIMGYYTYSRLLATLAHSLQCHGVVVLWGEMHWLQDWRSEAYPIFNWCIKKDTKLDTMIFHDFPLFVRAIFPRLPGLCKRLPTLLWEASGQNIAYAFICVLVCVFGCLVMCVYVPHIAACSRCWFCLFASLAFHFALSAVLSLPEQGCAHFGSNEHCRKLFGLPEGLRRIWAQELYALSVLLTIQAERTSQCIVLHFYILWAFMFRMVRWLADSHSPCAKSQE